MLPMADQGGHPTKGSRFTTGIWGWDQILSGGLHPTQNALIRGPPGSGKTIFGLHFLAAGTSNDESGLFINLGEPETYIEDTADHFGMDSPDLQFLNLSPSGEEFSASETYSLFESAEVEQPSLVGSIRSTVEEIEPSRVLIDPITELRYLTTDDHQFRKQILSLLDYLRAQEISVLLTSQAAETMPDDDLQFLVDAVVNLELHSDRRTVSVSKFRGSDFQRGQHSYEISADGVAVYPNLRPGNSVQEFTGETLSSGVRELDDMLHGGLERGTVTFLSGPTGAGKTTTGTQFLKEAAENGHRSVLYSFEESPQTLLHRADAVNIPLRELIDQGAVEIVEINPDDLTVDQFTARIQSDVEERDSEMVVIDGISGFKQGLRGLDGDATSHLITIGRYLRNRGVTTIFTNEVHDITGEFRATEEHTSNLADNVVFIRHVEVRGSLKKVIGVLKKRASDFGRELRELEITEDGLSVGEPLPELRGILTGTPEWPDELSDPESPSRSD